ncbi:MAG: LacI family DNA-binding transcriptional regulator [Lachnospiraceae bacterium]|nr:LacI family DNA-binding transcriptional regulator [Lachnospiraceae bacterium]
MAVTLQQIADKAGVSRRTVDRALNNKGHVNLELAEKIIEISKELGYMPNKAGRAMAMAKRNLKIGVIVQAVETPFIQDVVAGIEDAKLKVESLGGTVDIFQTPGINANTTIEIMETLKRKGYHAIALMPSESKELALAMRCFVKEYKIPIVTFNSDLENTGRLCFIGQNGIRSGRTTARLMGDIIGNQGKVLVVSGESTNNSLNTRVEGFEAEIKKNHPNVILLEPQYANDQNELSREITEKILDGHPDIRGIYIVGYGGKGVCDCLIARKIEKKIKVIAHDLIEENIRYLEKDCIDYLIGQDPFVQGYEPTMLLYRLLFESVSPKSPYRYTDILIKTKYNI